MKKTRPKRLLESKVMLVAFLLHSSVMSASMVVISIHIILTGGGEKEAGKAFSIAALVEILVLIWSAKLLNFLDYRRLLIIIFTMFATTYLAMSFTSSVYQLYISQVYGGTNLGGWCGFDLGQNATKPSRDYGLLLQYA